MAEECLSLMSKTRELLRNRDMSLPDIANATDVPFYWLRKFNYGEIKSPSVNRVQKLYEYLVGRKLDV